MTETPSGSKVHPQGCDARTAEPSVERLKRHQLHPFNTQASFHLSAPVDSDIMGFWDVSLLVCTVRDDFSTASSC